MRANYKALLFWPIAFLVVLLIAKQLGDTESAKSLRYSEFIAAVEQGHVRDVTFKGNQEILGRFKEDYQSGMRFKTIGSTGDETFKILRENKITPDFQENEKQGMFFSLLINWGPMLILVLIFYFFMRQLQAGGGKAMSFGKSRARMLSPNEKKVTFADVAGIEEAKEELGEIVDFLKSPKKYTALGGKIPKGVILVGPPGTGKTLLAKAIAGEANVPFFSISGSDFVEMFVGVGASRVRDLFESGKKNAPCIIFIDEIDAVGRHRGSGLGGGHDEREQTLNQLLVEMDGFESNEGVILIAATNRLDVLDPALLRPGRFDRRVTVPAPDVRGRLGILKVHTKKTPLAEDIDLEIIARGTPGFTGADIANLVNEAALQAARLDRKALTKEDFEYAKDKVLMGPERKSMAISEKDKKITAYHEAGHTLVGLNLPQTDPIHKVSIIPRGQALGVTQTLPQEEKLNFNRVMANNWIAFLLGGRSAEEEIFGEGEITSGASNDIERATHLARSMVCHWGMSPKLGPINFKKSGISPFAYGEQIDYSEKKAQEIDDEVLRVVEENHQVARKILKDNRAALERLASALILWETLDIEQVKKVVAGEDIGRPKLEKKKTNDDGTADKPAENAPASPAPAADSTSDISGGNDSSPA